MIDSKDSYCLYDVAVQFTPASFPGSSDEPGNEAKYTHESCDVPESCDVLQYCRAHAV